MRRHDLVFNVFLVLIDFALIVSAALAAYFLRLSEFVREIRPVMFHLPIQQYLLIVIPVAMFLLMVLAVSGLYTIRRNTPFFQEIGRVGIAISAGMMLIIVYMFFNRAWFDSRFIALGAWLLAIIFVVLGRLALRGIRGFLAQQKGVGIENIVVIGSDKEADSIRSQIVQDPKLGLRLLDILYEPDITYIQELHRKIYVHRVLVTNANGDRDKFLRLVSFCEENGIEFSYVPDMFGAIVADMHTDILEGVPVVSLRPSPLDGWGKVLKRALDILGSAVGLLLLSPVFLVVAFVIKWETDGPVLVKLKRVSRGKTFYLYKFRSMIKDAHKLKKELQDYNERSDSPLFKIKDDPRVTGVGKFLRAHRLDEIPQFINVLKGDMSLVGPRPHEPEEIEQYKEHHKKVLALKSGVTGMAQVSGAHDLPFEEEVKFDRFYIENWSLWKDITILLKTVKIFLFEKSGV